MSEAVVETEVETGVETVAEDSAENSAETAAEDEAAAAADKAAGDAADDAAEDAAEDDAVDEVVEPKTKEQIAKDAAEKGADLAKKGWKATKDSIKNNPKGYLLFAGALIYGLMNASPTSSECQTACETRAYKLSNCSDATDGTPPLWPAINCPTTTSDKDCPKYCKKKCTPDALTTLGYCKFFKDPPSSIISNTIKGLADIPRSEITWWQTWGTFVEILCIPIAAMLLWGIRDLINKKSRKFVASKLSVEP